jgi:hypothetical protein
VDVDELYGLPLDRFTPERNALARELRSGGERERGAEVAALRKPSVAAWAVNQLVRTQKRAIGELLEAGDGLRAAQDDVLAGRGDAGSLRAAMEREREAVESLIGSAGGLLSSDGQELSPTIIDRVADTLHAAALDDDARTALTDGRLERELRHVGLGMASGGGTPATAPAPRARRTTAPGTGRAPAKKGTAKKSAAGRKPTESAADRRATERAARERAQAEAQARAEERALEREARRRLERAERGAELALERRDRAAQALEAAEAELTEAEGELRDAQARLSELER